MKKLLGGLASVAFSVLVSLPLGAEAKTVAILPLVDSVANVEGLSEIFYDRSLEAVHKQKVYELVESEEIDAAIKKYTKPGVMPKPDALFKIAEEGNVDLVIAAEVKKVQKNIVKKTGDRKLRIIVRGNFISFDNETGKVSEHEANTDKTIMEALNTRWDVKMETWANMVSHEMHRILGVKDLNLEGPKLSALK